ncbi:MAG TPA: amidohydrolase [Clostridiales bacterium]|nr:amidohydrolase [Clostridiales bacterium]
MLAVASGLVKSGAMKNLTGRVKFLGTPAEESGIFDALSFKKEGKIHMPTGKAEMILEGVFDDVDMAMQMHCWSHAPNPLTLRIVRNLGMIGITAHYRGKQAHSASEAFNGINALYAAITGVNLVHMLRERFNEKDHSRIHCVIAEGGANPNSITDYARVECFVKSNNLPAMENLMHQVLKALKAGADALGAEFDVEVTPGMFPMQTDDIMSDLYIKNSAMLMPGEYIKLQEQQLACSDLGDVSQLMPVLYPQAGGVEGTGHGVDFKVVDFNSAVILPAKAFAATIIDLLNNNAEIARKVIEAHTPSMTKQEYLDRMEKYYSIKWREGDECCE